MKIVKNIFCVVLGIIGIAGLIGLCCVGGYIIRWFLWLICFVWEIFFGKTALTTWIGNHDIATHIICSFLTPIAFALIIFSESGDSSSSSGANHYSTTTSYYNGAESTNKNGFSFVDCSGCYRHWGDDFIDHQGNWCKWGTGFYDYDDNYIRWGETYKDCSGAYRRWGDTFIDCAGNHIHIP